MQMQKERSNAKTKIYEVVRKQTEISSAKVKIEQLFINYNNDDATNYYENNLSIL